MKRILLSAVSLALLGSVANATEFYPDLKRPMSYEVEIQDSNHKTLYTETLNNSSQRIKDKTVEVSYIDNCIKENGIVSNTKSFFKSGFKAALRENSSVSGDLVITISKVVANNKIDTGECSIEELSIGQKTITQSLPLLSYEHKFYLNDSSGKQLPDLYYVKVSGKYLN